jgi:hypothetical protein
LLHRAAVPASDTPQFQVQVNPIWASGQIPDPMRAAIVPSVTQQPARPATCFFERRVSAMIRACGSPKTPVTVGRGENPGKR